MRGPAHATTTGQRVAAYLACNGTAAAVNVTCSALLEPAMPYWASVAGGYLAGMATAYTLTRSYVFGASGRRLRVELARFALVNAVTLTQVLAVSAATAEWVLPALGVTWHAGTLAHVVGVGSPVLVSYHAHRRFSFAAAPQAAMAEAGAPSQK